MVSILFGYPINFVLLRKEVSATLQGRVGRKPLTVGLLVALAGVSTTLRDVGVVQAIFGASFGSFLVFIAPVIMAYFLRRRLGTASPKRTFAEVLLAAYGMFIGYVGVASVLH